MASIPTGLLPLRMVNRREKSEARSQNEKRRGLRYDLSASSGFQLLTPDSWLLTPVLHRAAVTSLACKLILVPASAFDTGHPFLAFSASSWNFEFSTPGTSASVVRSILVMAKPPSALSNCTVAFVWMRLGVKPAWVSWAESAIEKHQACAALISSSGFVPGPVSILDLNEYGPS